MSLVDPLIDEFFPAVKGKKNSTQDLKARVGRVIRYSRETVVKISGYKSAAGVFSHMSYISRNGKVELEDDQGLVYEGWEEVKDFYNAWDDFDTDKRRKRQRDVMSVILSMPKGTHPEAVRAAAREFAEDVFKDHEYVFAFHQEIDEETGEILQPHVHIAVKMKAKLTEVDLAVEPGKRMQTNPETLFEWRCEFRDKLLEQGIDAEATPRATRGSTKKGQKSVINHIEKGDKTHKPRTSKARAKQTKEAIDEVLKKSQRKKPWETNIQAKKERSAQAWEKVAKHFEASDPAFAAEVRQFASNLPDEVTQNEELTRQMIQKLEAFKKAADQERAEKEASRKPSQPQEAPKKDEGRDRPKQDKEEDLEL